MDPVRFVFELLEEYSAVQKPETEKSSEENAALQDRKVGDTPLDFKIG